MSKPAIILITGATGWLGKGLINTLFNGIDGLNLPKINKEDSIRILVLPGEDLSFFEKYSKQIEIVIGDIRNKKDCKFFLKNSKNAVLYHTAGIIHPKKILDFYAINVEGTLNILNEANKALVKRAVVVSSNSPIGCNTSPDKLFDENSPFNPYMNYGRSKMLMEKAIMALQPKLNIDIVRIRAPWFYGPFQPDRQSLFFKMIKNGKGPIVGDGNNMRSMAYIDNLCQGLILAGNIKKIKSTVYWIADEKPYSMNMIIDTIEDVLRNDFGIQCIGSRLRLPSFIADIAYLLDKFIQLMGMYHQKIHVLSEMNKTIACSVELAKRELGYSPQVELREGMRRSIQWMLDNGLKL
jgi:nucleoside-diphosphate-sugar epimerase